MYYIVHHILLFSNRSSIVVVVVVSPCFCRLSSTTGQDRFHFQHNFTDIDYMYINISIALVAVIDKSTTNDRYE